MSYYALCAGLLTSIPAVMSGGAQAFKMIQSQGLYEQDKKTIKPKVKITLAHAAINDVVIAVSAYIWWIKRQGTIVTYQPDTWVVGASVLLGLALVFTANLGGTLTYNYGVGMSIAKGKGKAS